LGDTMAKPTKQVKTTQYVNSSDTELTNGSEPFFKYPSLENLIDESGSKGLADMRARLEQTKQDLERVVRQGPKADAARARRVVSAYETTLQLLAEVEQMKEQE
jgi:hypothetical protein